MRHRHPTSAFTLFEITVVVVIIGIMAAFAGRGMLNARRLKEDQAMIGRAQSLDQAQLLYLTRHPGESLSSPGADAEIRELVNQITRNIAGSQEPGIAAIVGNITFDTSVRPATVKYEDRTMTYPR